MNLSTVLQGFLRYSNNGTLTGKHVSTITKEAIIRQKENKNGQDERERGVKVCLQKAVKREINK
jgi:hypothetical protein